MANMANITVKKADGTTDIVYVAKQAAAGDSSPARWAADSVSTIPGHRPTFQLRTRDNGPKTARAFESAFRFPVVVLVSGVPTVVGTIPVNTSGTLPQGIELTYIQEAVAQSANLVASSLYKQSLVEGYAPV